MIGKFLKMFESPDSIALNPDPPTSRPRFTLLYLGKGKVGVALTVPGTDQFKLLAGFEFEDREWIEFLITDLHFQTGRMVTMLGKRALKEKKGSQEH